MTDYLREYWPESLYVPDKGWPDAEGRVCATGALREDCMDLVRDLSRLVIARGVPVELRDRWAHRFWHWNNRHGHEAAIRAIECYELVLVAPKCPSHRDAIYDLFAEYGPCRRQALLPSEKLIPAGEREWMQ